MDIELADFFFYQLTNGDSCMEFGQGPWLTFNVSMTDDSPMPSPPFTYTQYVD